MPQAAFLLPGVGAQGGRVERLAPALGQHRASVLISSSRGIVGAGAGPGGDPAENARREAARLQELAWNLGP
jgi:orotidine-5'-phosphate decarboxylase